MNKKRGFTLIELIVTISILSILLVILLDIYGGLISFQVNTNESYRGMKNVNTATRSILEFLDENEGAILESDISTNGITIDSDTTYIKHSSNMLYIKTPGIIENIDVKVPITGVKFTVYQNGAGSKLLKIKVTNGDIELITVHPLVLKGDR